MERNVSSHTMGQLADYSFANANASFDVRTVGTLLIS